MHTKTKVDLESSSEEERLQKGSHQQQDGTEVATHDDVLMIKEINNNDTYDDEDGGEISNEYVLNVAFWTFLGFLLLEAVFAIIAGSQAMLEDAEAMTVDAITYLFNLCAERIKNRPYSEKELQMPVALRDYRRERLRLYLELIPPLISVVTLVVVTMLALQDAFEDLFGSKDDEVEEEDVDVFIMLIFSAANLLLDLVNVLCFARAHQAVGISTTIGDYQESTRYSLREDVILAQGNNKLEMENLVDHHHHQDVVNSNGEGYGSFNKNDDDHEEYNGIGHPAVNHVLVNLNMCSAWTHVCADTLRSVSVLIAAAIAFCFESVSGAMADSCAVIVVSLIILISLMPLLHGLYITAHKIIALQKPSSF